MSNEVERKTAPPDQSDAETARLNRFKPKDNTPVYMQGSGKNILNGYRSISYNFTLAGLPSAFLKDPNTYREKELDLVIAKSGGKATTSAMRGSGLAQEFNQKSPGRFDLFIENVEMSTVSAFSPQANVSMPTSIKFDIIEPYSVNGFIEALNVAALESGYSSQLNASYVLKLEFWGIPDSDVLEFKPPEKIPKSTRYFPILITKVEIDVTERGTLYRVEATPVEQATGFGSANKLKKSVKMTGNTVREILENLMSNITEQNKKSNKEGKANPNNFDEWKIKFPSLNSDGTWTGPENKIAPKKVVEILRENTLYKHDDPSTSTKENNYKTSSTPSKHIPRTSEVHFAENAQVHEIISSVIRDSEYVMDIVKNIDKLKDANGMIDYFMVRTEIRNKEGTCFEEEKRPYREITYVVTPYKVHYTKLPMFVNEQYQEENLQGVSLREYNYFYMGKNVDVLKFKLNFNTLYYNSLPVAFGNKLTPNAKTSTTSKPEEGEVKIKDASCQQQRANEIPLQPVHMDSSSVSVNTSQGLGNQIKDSPYDALAKAIHESLIHSLADMIVGEIEILGDPYYLVTGGMGNYDPKTESNPYLTQDGEANINYGQLLITVNFRNPIDIGTFEQGGLMQFDPKRVPFSGVYRVNTISHYFRDGVFKQKLDVVRMPGQILKNNDNLRAPVESINSPGSKLVTTADRNEPAPSGSSPFIPEQRMNVTSGLNEVLNRGVPSSGLPGELSNFTDATGGLGGTEDLVKNLGNIPIPSLLQSAASIVGKELPKDITSDIRMSFSGLSELMQTGLNVAAQIQSAAAIATNSLSFKNVASTIADTIQNSELTSALSKFNPGSGLGVGADAPVSWNGEIADPTGFQAKFGENINPLSLPTGAISNVANSLVTTKAMQTVNNLASPVSNIVNDVSRKINSTLGSVADPMSIAKNVGLDSSRISGLSPALTSKVNNQIRSLINNVPKDVNLNAAINAGVSFAAMSADSLKNIPPTQTQRSAPVPTGNQNFINQIVQQSGIRGLENLYNTKNVGGLAPNIVPTQVINNTINSVLRSSSTPLGNLSISTNGVDQVAMQGRVSSADSMLGSITGQVRINDKNVSGSVGTKFGSVSFNKRGIAINASPLGRLIGNKG